MNGDLCSKNPWKKFRKQENKFCPGTLIFFRRNGMWCICENGRAHRNHWAHNKVASDFWTWVLLPEAKQKLLVHYWRIVKQMVSLKREWWLSQMTVFSHNGSMIIEKFLWEMEMLCLIMDHTSYLSSWTISQAKLSTHLEQFCFWLLFSVSVWRNLLNFCLSVDLYLRYDIWKK